MRCGACGTAIRSLAWPGSGGQEGSETSGVSPNNNPRRERPASSFGLRRPLHWRVDRGIQGGVAREEDEIVQASWKREGP